MADPDQDPRYYLKLQHALSGTQDVSCFVKTLPCLLGSESQLNISLH